MEVESQMIKIELLFQLFFKSFTVKIVMQMIAINSLHLVSTSLLSTAILMDT
jgi:hypothetical protein